MATILRPWTPTPRTRWQEFRRDPIFQIAINKSGSGRIRLVCISDTHNTQPPIPDGDVLLHSGDLTNGGTFSEIQAQLKWLNSLPHRHKIVIAGNHDRLLDADFVNQSFGNFIDEPGPSRADLDWYDVTYLQNSSVTISLPISNPPLPFSSSVKSQVEKPSRTTLKIYGSPFTPHCGTFAFQYPPIRDVWRDSVPDDADIVLTHGPPKGYLDSPSLGRASKGCPHLVREVRRVKPRVVVFGHIHSGHGREDIQWAKGVERRFSQIAGMAEKQRGQWVLILAMVVGLIAAWAETLISRATKGRWKGSKQRKETIMINAAIGADKGTDRKPVVVDLST